MKRISVRKRIVYAGLALVSLIGSGVAYADPVSDLRALLLQATNVQATGVGPTQIVVAWTDHSTVENGFRIEMALDENGPYTSVTHAPKCDQSPNPMAPNPAGARVCVAAISNVAPRADTAPRFIRVVPFIEVQNGGSSPGSGMLLAEGPPSAADVAILGAEPPTNFVCNGGGTLACTNVTDITLTWTDNSDENEFWIMRAKGGINPNFGSAPHRILPANTTTFNEQNRDFGGIYSYKAVAVRRRNILRADGLTVTEELSFSDAAGQSVAVAEISPIPPPTNPSGLNASYTPPNTGTLSWSDITPPGDPYIDEDGWFIEFGPSIGNWQTVMTKPGTTGQGTRTFVDTSLVPDVLRCYQVRAYRSTQGSSPYPAFSRFTNAICLGSVPKAPTSLAAKALSNATVELTWKDNSNAEDSFAIERCTGICTASSPVCTSPTCANGTWKVIDNGVPANTTKYVDPNTDGLTTYTYRVFAKNATGRSPSSNIAAVTTPVEPVKAPTDLLAVGRAHAIFLSWTDRATDETGYRIEYRPPAGDWARLIDLPRNSIQYLDTANLSANQTRCYRVRSLKSAQVSDATDEECAKTLPPQAPNGAPTDIVGVVQSNTSIVLSWYDNATNETAFRIEYAVFPNLGCGSPQTRPSDAVGRFQFLMNAVPVQPNNQQAIDPASPPGTRSVVLTGLIPHTAYYFRVKAINPDGESAWGTANPPAEQPNPAGGPNLVYPNVTECRQTFGPPVPVYVDPDKNGSLDATRCTFTVRAPRTTGPDRVSGLRIYVVAQVAESNIAHTDTLYIVPNDGFVPGAKNDPNSSQYVVTERSGTRPFTFHFSTTNPSDFVINYQFRKGPIYKLMTTAYADNAAHWASQTAIRTDMKVLADCPQSGV